MSWIEGVVVTLTVEVIEGAVEVFEGGGQAGQEDLRPAVKTSLA